MTSTTTMASASAERRWSSSSHSKERFPDLDHSQPGTYLAAYGESDDGATMSRTPSPAKTNGTVCNDRWQPRKDHQLAWGNGHINVSGPRGHSRQKSLSEAFRTIRNRRASVSENAHEIAEALKAPISYKVIVRGCEEHDAMPLLTLLSGSLPRLVFEFCINEYFIQVYPERLSQTNHPYHHTVRLCFWLVPFLRIPCATVSAPQNHHTSSEERHSISDPRRNSNDPAACPVPNWRSHPLIDSH